MLKLQNKNVAQKSVPMTCHFKIAISQCHGNQIT